MLVDNQQEAAFFQVDQFYCPVVNMCLVQFITLFLNLCLSSPARDSMLLVSNRIDSAQFAQ